jgi:UTP--glucose-1-phosphate uridylyltransferase
MKIRKAVIPCAGLGTRFLPVTKTFPKEMLPIINVPNLEYIIKEAFDSGIEEVILVVSDRKSMIAEYFKVDDDLNNKLKDKAKEIAYIHNNYKNITYCEQRVMKGLGDAILCARHLIGDEPFAVMLGDDLFYSDDVPVLKQMIDLYDKTGASILGCNLVSDNDLKKYGVVRPIKQLQNDLYKIDDIIEKPQSKELAPSNISVLGRYVFDNQILNEIANQVIIEGKELQLTPAIASLAKKKEVDAYIYKGIRYDIGDKFSYVKALIEYGLRNEEIKEELKEYLKNKTL